MFDDHFHSTKQARRRHRRKHTQHTASSSSFDNNHSDTLAHIDDIVSKKSALHHQYSETSSNEYVVAPLEIITNKNSLHDNSDSDDESDRLPVKPWSPVPPSYNSSPSLVPANNIDNQDNATTSTPQLALAIREVFGMITEDLDRFVYTPAPNGFGDIQCRITRDKRGMEKGLFPTYYMHAERPGDGKKVKFE